MSNDELAALVKRIRTQATSPAAMSASLNTESTRVARKPRAQTEAQQKRKAILDQL